MARQATLRLVEGNTEPTRFRLTNTAKPPVAEDLAAFASITADVRLKGGGRKTVVGVVVGPTTDGVFDIPWIATDLLIGEHELEITFVRGTGEILTMPNDQRIRLIVRDRIGTDV